MKLKTIAIDDEPIALEKLRQYIEKTSFLELCGTYCSPLEAMEAIHGAEIDLIFTDINMPDINGLDFVKSLTSPPMTVFTTAYADYAVESYKVAALDYLLKPYSFADFHRSACKALEHYKVRKSATQVAATKVEERKSLFIKVDYKYIRVEFSAICYIKGYGEYLQIYLEGRQQPLVTLSSFAAIMQQLPTHFLQVHRSYIVNIDQIDRIEKNRIIIAPDTYIPIGDTFKPAFDARVQGRVIGGK